MLEDSLKEIKKLSKASRKAPWGFGGKKVKGGTIYKLGETEERLIIKMRNSIDELISEYERLTNQKL